MSISLKILTVSALLATSMAQFPSVALAAPIGEPLAIARTIPSPIEPVYWRGRGWGWGRTGGRRDLSPGRSSAAPWLHPITPPAIIQPLVTTTGLLRAMRSRTACNVSGRMIRLAATISRVYDGYRHPCP